MKPLFFLLAFLITSFAFSQKMEENDVKSYRIAFITERLDLSSEEAKVFWPIHNKHNKRYDELKENVWEPIKKKLKAIDELSDKEAESLLQDYRDYRKKRLEYREKFIKELLTVISPKKVMQLKKADYDFNKELLKQYKANN